MNKIDITKWKEDIIKSTCELIKIPSVNEESNNPEKPFGNGPDEALKYVLNLGEKLGFKTKNIDGYCGYIEFGEGEEILGIIGHLDVVPVGEGWKHEPFGGEIENGRIYGRGAIDDKGPVIASLYAMKAVMEQVNVNKRIRLILGLNEERDWKCINYYKEHEESPSFGFSPDADFPCIYAEKGLLSTYIIQDYSGYKNEKIEITNIDCNSNPINVVPKYFKVDLKVKNIEKLELIEYIKENIRENNFNIEIEEKNDRISLVSHGVSSHAAHPDLGINAISMLLIVINNIFQKYDIKIEIFEQFSKLVGMQYYGENLKIDYEDESGKLTLNVGNCVLEENKIKIGMNLRIPVTIKISDIEEKFNEILKGYHNLELEFEGEKKPLYIEKQNQLITALCNTFNEVTGKNEEPIAIGGATYARAFKNCVSFGANMPGEKDMCHQVDEFVSIENLITACQIYAEAIYKLAHV